MRGMWVVSVCLLGCTENELGKLTEPSIGDDSASPAGNDTADPPEDDTGTPDPIDDTGSPVANDTGDPPGGDTGSSPSDDTSSSPSDDTSSSPSDDTSSSPSDDTSSSPSDDTGEAPAEPEVLSLSLSPDPVYTDDGLMAEATMSDGAGVSWTWSVAGVEIGETTFELDGRVWFDKHQEVTVTATPVDGGATGTPMSASVTVSNSTPGAPMVAIRPSAPVAGVDPLRCVIDSHASDDDGDFISYSAVWTVDGVSHGGGLSTTSFSSDTVAASETSAGEVWVCTVTPNDGEVDGPTDSAVVTIDGPAVATCSDDLSGLGTPVVVGSGYSSTGNWVADAHPAGLSGFWVFPDYDDDDFEKYVDKAAITARSAERYYSIEDDWAGTGHAIMDGQLYYQEKDSGVVVRYDLALEDEVVRVTLPGAGVDHDFDYWWGGLTSMDFSSDGESLYVIHSKSSAAGRFVVTQLDPSSLSVIDSWTAPSGVKGDYSNAFMACGVLYAVDSFYEDTTVNYAWEVGSSREWDPAIAWDVLSYLTAVNYNPVYGEVFAYDGGNLITFSPSW
jgi:hypothetical protein